MGLLFFVVTGTLAGLASALPVWWPLALAWLAWAGAWLWSSRAASLPLLYITLFFAAWAQAGTMIQEPSPRALRVLMERPREHVVVRGLITDDPVEHLDPAGGPPVWRLTMRTHAINRVGFFERASGMVDVQWLKSADAARPDYGDIWEFTGVLHHREWSDWRWAFLPPYRLRADPSQARLVERSAGSRLKQFAFAGRRAAAERLGAGLEDFPETAGILRALLLGYRHELPRDQHRLFAQSGTLHIFAISGLHVGLLAGLLLIVARTLGASHRTAVLWIAPVLIVYTVATGLRPSAVRACVMTLAFGSAFLFYRKPDPPSALALAALLILAAAPAQLTSPGFIFSFVIVAGLIRLYPVFSGSAHALFAPDGFVQDPEQGDASPGRSAARWIIGLVAASVAAWLSSVWLTAQYFNLFSPIGLIGNLLVIPAAFVVVLAGVLSVLTGTVWQVGAEVFNHANRVILHLLTAVIDVLVEWPGAHRHVRSPGPFWLGLGYAFIFAGLLWRTRRARTIGYAVLALCAVAGFWLARFSASDAVRVLDAGDGHAVLIQSGRRHLLYDAGPAFRAERLLRDLRAEGVNRLDVLMLSHAAAAHAGGAETVLRSLPVGALWCTAFPSRSPAYDAALAAARERGVPIVIRQAGDRGRWPGGLAWEVLHPRDAAAHRRAADASLVLRLHKGTASVLLSGGAGEAVERALLGRRVDPAARVWVIGNQGRDGVAGLDWLSAVRPDDVVLAVGAYNRYGGLEDDVRMRLEQDKDGPPFRLWRTDETGSVDIRLSSGVRFGRQRDAVRIRSEWDDAPE